MATAGSIIIDLLMKTGAFETDSARAAKRLQQLKKEADKLRTGSKVELVSKQQFQDLERLAGINPFSKIAVGGIAASGVFVSLSDEATKLTGILRSATSENVAYSQSFSDVNRIASAAQVGLVGVGTAYARIANALQEFGAEQRDVAAITETLSLALKVNGATSAEATSTLIQLSQAFGKGKLDGDEFRTAMEAAPPVMRQLAKSLGVPFGALKDLAAEGKITSEVLLKAFTDQEYLDSLRRQASSMRTIGGSITEVRNALVGLVGSFNSSTGAATLVSEVISGVATSVQFLTDTVNRKPIDWNKYFDTSNLPIGLQVYVDPDSGQVLVGKIAEVEKQRKKLQEELDKRNVAARGGKQILPRGATLNDAIPAGILSKEDAGGIAGFQQELKKQDEAINSFLSNSKLQTADEKLKQDLKNLDDSFKEATKGLQEGTPKYLEALDAYQNRRKALLDKGNKEQKIQNDSAEELAKVYADLLAAAQQLGNVEDLSPADKLQEQLDAITKVDAATKSYVQTIIDEARARETLQEFQEQDRLNLEFDERELAALEEESAAAASAIEDFKQRSEKAFLETLTPAEQLEFQIQAIRLEAEALGLDQSFADPLVQQLIEASDEAKNTRDQFKDLERAIDGFSRDAASSVADLAFGIKTSFSDVVTSILKDLARIALQKSIFDPFADFATGLFSGGSFSALPEFVPAFLGFANGGRPPTNRPSLVGERGPELFMPDTAGRIIPNSMLTDGGAVNVSVNVDASGSSVQGDSDKSNQLGSLIAGAVRSIIIQEKRSGGLLA